MKNGCHSGLDPESSGFYVFLVPKFHLGMHITPQTTKTTITPIHSQAEHGSERTLLDDISGLKLSKSKSWTLKEIYIKEAENIVTAMLKYLSAQPSRKEAPFSYEWLLKLHEEMFGDVWEWAGKLRQIELSIGIKAYLPRSQVPLGNAYYTPNYEDNHYSYTLPGRAWEREVHSQAKHGSV